MDYTWELGVEWYQNEMKNISKSGDSDRLTISSILAKLTLIQVFKSIQITYSLKNTTRMGLKYHMQDDEATNR